jgi:hypothetical protein
MLKTGTSLIQCFAYFGQYVLGLCVCIAGGYNGVAINGGSTGNKYHVTYAHRTAIAY